MLPTSGVQDQTMVGLPSARLRGSWSWHRVSFSPSSRSSLRVRICRDDRERDPELKDLPALAATLSSQSVAQVELSCGRDELEDVSQSVWLETFVGALPETHSLERLRFAVPYCRPSLTDDKLVHLLPKLAGLRDLEVADGLYTHTDTFARSLPKLERLERLALVDTSHRAALSHGCAEALATAIRSLPCLRVFRLSRARFKRPSDLALVLEALVDKVELEDVAVSGLSVAGCPNIDLASFHSLFAEHSALQAARRAREDLGPHCMSDYLRALIQVRSWKPRDANTTATAATTTTGSFTTLAALSVVSDRLDCSYHLLRYEVDPGSWSQGSERRPSSQFDCARMPTSYS